MALLSAFYTDRLGKAPGNHSSFRAHFLGAKKAKVVIVVVFFLVISLYFVLKKDLAYPFRAERR